MFLAHTDVSLPWFLPSSLCLKIKHRNKQKKKQKWLINMRQGSSPDKTSMVIELGKLMTR